MASLARATQTFPGTVSAAQACWYDTSRWSRWVDGLARIVTVEGDWPREGAAVSWESHPAGRGRVVERVSAFEDGDGQTVEVDDDSIHGRQTVAFTAVDGGVQVSLSLEYTLANRSLVTPILDALFIRRAMTASLRRTVARFGGELATRASNIPG
jgi:polyketide cyclase/dehydrase/lipid transport protein